MLDEFEVLISSYARNICEFYWIFKLVFPMRLVAVTLLADSHCDKSRSQSGSLTIYDEINKNWSQNHLRRFLSIVTEVDIFLTLWSNLLIPRGWRPRRLVSALCRALAGQTPAADPNEETLDRFWRRVAELTTRYYDADHKWIHGNEIRAWNIANRQVGYR